MGSTLFNMAGMAALLVLAPSTGALAQFSETSSSAPRRQGAAEVLASDGAEYASRHSVPLEEAMRRLRAQEESVPATERIRQQYRDRLAGISIEHSPDYRIVVLLAGDEPVAEQRIFAGGMMVPLEFRTGALATRDQIFSALIERQPAIRAALGDALGMGLDQRTGELVVYVRDAGSSEMISLDSELEAIAGVPVRVDPLDRQDENFGVEGGSRLIGTDPANGRRYVCTTGFAVTDGARTGIITAAHCPDSVTYQGSDGSAVPLDFVGQWGVGYQDVQVHVGNQPQGPYFYAHRDKKAVRTLTGRRARASTRAGDFVCHRGESSGYSCSAVELTDFSPPGDLCAGPCTPSWVTVKGPDCRNGDSGGPVFNGTVAFGIAKGGSYLNGRCAFYYYMSTDFLPEGWSLLTAGPVPPAASRRLDRE